jgi:ribosome maturation factor RimP
MAKENIAEMVFEIAYPVIEEHGFELVDVEYVREGSNWYLRVFIDKPGGITIDDCQTVSEKLSEKIDRADLIGQSYFFEVSSPGLDRPLKKDGDFERYKGETVELRVYKPINGRKDFEGTLEGLIDGKICITDEKGERMSFDRDAVAVVKRSLKL